MQRVDLAGGADALQVLNHGDIAWKVFDEERCAVVRRDAAE